MIVILIFGLLVIPLLVHAQQPYEFGACADRSSPEYNEISVRSLYIPMRDGVRIAVDVVLPKDLAPGKKIPTILMMTRYWRAFEGEEPRPTNVVGLSFVVRPSPFFVSHGYAFVSGDSRGTGASFGVWRYHRNRDETRDFGEIVSWIVAQPWSNGRVGGYGVSYTANTADWTAQKNHPAVKAIVPRFADFDPYEHQYFPGGINLVAFSKRWSAAVRRMDLNVPRGDPPRGVKPVDGDTDGQLLRQAIEKRRDIPEVYEGLRQITFRDDLPSTWDGASMNDWSIHTHVKDLERSRVAMYSQGSWLDRGTADGGLRRFVTLRNPQRAVIGSWFHGGVGNANPFVPPETPADPSPEVQLKEALCYFDHYLKGVPNGMSGRLLIYYTMGEEKWKTTKVWPPAGSTRQRWYLAADHALSRKRPESDSDTDQYRVDFEATTARNRWFWPLRQEAIYPDRAEQDRRLLTYTSDMLAGDVEITGHPVVSLYVTSTATDGAFFVYLEDVDPTGKITYITEGELRALHRKVSKERPPHKMLVPYHSFLRKDASPLVPGEVAELRFGLLPTSVLIKKGHRLRIAIAGADKETFARIPENETPVISVLRHKRYASFIDLPVIRRH